MEHPLDSIATAQRMLGQRQLSPSELTQIHLAQIDRYEPKIKAWSEVHREAAIGRARQLDAQWPKHASASPLFAIPYGAKDIFHTKGRLTEAGSRVLAGHRPDDNAAVIDKLDAQGAVLLGKTTTTEFANWGGPPPTCNPWALDHTPGGSSSGSAAAVAADMALFALGTQTAGSLTRPAAYNGLSVLKASYGRISKAGVIPASESLDHVGAFTHSVEDAVIVYNALAGPEPRDPATWQWPYEPLRTQGSCDYLIGWITHRRFEDVDPALAAALEEARRVLESRGARFRCIAPPEGFEAACRAHATVMQAEVASYHAEAFAAHAERYGTYLQEFIAQGLNICANDYIRAQQRRRQYRQSFSRLFDEVDLLLTPAAPGPAPQGLSSTGSPAYNLPFTNLGVPTLALPIGFTAGLRLPLGMQLVAPFRQEQRLIDVGHAFQRETDWHRRRPRLEPT